MLTVKHIHASGNESIHVAREVRYDCGSAPDSITDAPALWLDTPSGDTQCLGSFGTFFVMNEGGKTVARYNLGVAAVPDDGRLADRNPFAPEDGLTKAAIQA